MRSRFTVAPFAALFCTAVLMAGCVAGVAPDGAAPFGVEESTFAVVEFARAGGPDSLDEQAVMYLDGHVLLERDGEPPVTFQLSPAEQSQIDAAFEAADFFTNAQTAGAPAAESSPAEVVYQISRHGLLLQGALSTSDETAPPWAQPLIPLLSNLLLTPDPASVQRYQPEQPSPATVQSTAAAPALVLIEFTRRSAEGEERVLLNLDRSYSVAAGGEVTEGALSEAEMAALLKTIEEADLRRQAGDYLDEAECPDCAAVELVYRNVFGQHVVRAAEGQEPDWFVPVVQALAAQFLSTSPPSAGGVRSTATPLASAAPATPTPDLSATPTTAAAVTATATVTTTAVQYTTLDLLADLANLGAQVEVAPGRVVKPYLSTYGLIVRVDGEPVQLFQYPDEASLLADVEGLSANAASIDGLTLTWPAAPHFWRKGGLLALAITDEAYYVELLSQVLGTPFAGQ